MKTLAKDSSQVAALKSSRWFFAFADGQVNWWGVVLAAFSSCPINSYALAYIYEWKLKEGVEGALYIPALDQM